MTRKNERREPLGYARLSNARLNKGTAFTLDERTRYRLRGLLPAHVSSPEEQETRALANLRRKTDDIERYIFLQALQGRNEQLFYRLLVNHIEELLPLVYTPTVGQACQEFAHIFRQARGFYITPDDRGEIRAILDNWPEDDVRLIVVTDGERILGLGDLGANGMGIPIGKLSLYTACAGIPPAQCMPVMLDVGTDNESLRNDPLYLGIERPRLRGAPYDALVEEFVNAIQDAFPGALIQFEDFLTPNAYALLERYRERVLCFNDDIQGTAAVALAGVLAAGRISGVPLHELRILFLGAGSAATGIAGLLQVALQDAGLDAQTARERLWLVNSSGLVVQDSARVAPHMRPYAHDAAPRNFHDAIRTLRPQVLIGATGSAGSFSADTVRLMAQINEHPVIFALSNPTAHAECTAQQAWQWSDGHAIFASGSPFGPVDCNGRWLRPGQANNVYVFPGIGLGALTCRARCISDGMLLAAARTLAARVRDDDLASGTIYPPLSAIREVSAAIAAAVAEQAWREGCAQVARPLDIDRSIRSTTPEIC